VSDGEPHAGGCLCGAVRYRINGPLRDVFVCHCTVCARTHGGPAPYSACERGDLELVETRGLLVQGIDEVDRARESIYRITAELDRLAARLQERIWIFGSRRKIDTFATSLYQLQARIRDLEVHLQNCLEGMRGTLK